MTPAPWIIETHATKYPDLFTYNVVAPQGWTDPETKQHRTCAVASGLDEGEDARLIAAAPDLLHALKELQQAVRDCRLLDVKKRFTLCCADAQANTAIAKAEGNLCG